MSNENLGERLRASLRVATGQDEAIPIDDLNNLRNRANKNESVSTHEARMKWMEAPFLVLQVRGEEPKTVLARYVNPKVHSAFSPAIKIDIGSKKLVGRKLSLEFLINSNSLPKVISLPASHMLQEGPNVIMPRIAIKTDAFPEDNYSVSVAIPAGFILNTTTFPITKNLDDQLQQGFADVLEDGTTLQDLIELVEGMQK